MTRSKTVSHVIEAPSLADGTNLGRFCVRCQTGVREDKREIVDGKGQNWIASVCRPSLSSSTGSLIERTPPDDSATLAAARQRPFSFFLRATLDFFNDFTRWRDALINRVHQKCVNRCASLLRESNSRNLESLFFFLFPPARTDRNEWRAVSSRKVTVDVRSVCEVCRSDDVKDIGKNLGCDTVRVRRIGACAVIRTDRGTGKTRQDRETDVVQTIDLDFSVALDRLRYLALTMSSLLVAP